MPATRLASPTNLASTKPPFISLTLSSPLSKSSPQPPIHLSSQAPHLPFVKSCRSYGWPFTSTNFARVRGGHGRDGWPDEKTIAVEDTKDWFGEVAKGETELSNPEDAVLKGCV